MLWFAVRGRLDEYYRNFPDTIAPPPAAYRAVLYERYHWTYREVEETPLAEREFLAGYWIPALKDLAKSEDPKNEESPWLVLPRKFREEYHLDSDAQWEDIDLSELDAELAEHRKQQGNG